MYYDDGLFVDGCDCFDEVVAVVPGVEVVAVARVFLDFNVSFARVGVYVDDGVFGVLGCGGALLGIVVGGGGDCGSVFLGTRLDCIEGCDEVLGSC